MPLITDLPDQTHPDGWTSDEQDMNYSITVHPPSGNDTVGDKDGTGPITTTSTPNPGDVQSEARPDDWTITDLSKSTVVPKSGPGWKAKKTDEQTTSKEIIYLDDLRDNLTVAFTEGLGKLKDDIERQSQHAHEIKSQLANMQKDVTKLIPQTKEMSLLKNSVEASHADLNTVGSVVVAMKAGMESVQTDVPKTVSELSNLKAHVLGVRQEVMCLKADNHGVQSKMVGLKLQSETINDNVTGGHVEGQSLTENIRLLKDDCQNTNAMVTSLRTQVKTVENEIATVKSDVSQIKSDISSIKQNFDNFFVNVAAMKSALSRPPVVGTGCVQDVQLEVDIKEDPGSNGEEDPVSNVEEMQSQNCSALSCSEVSFKPVSGSKTYDKDTEHEAAVLHGEPTQQESGPNEIPDTGMCEYTQRVHDDPDAGDVVEEEERFSGDDAEESQMSPSQSIISGERKERRHHVPDTVEEESIQWPDDSDAELKDNRIYGKGKQTFFPPEYIVEAVQKFHDAHGAHGAGAPSETDIPPPPPPTPSKKFSRRKAKRGARKT